MSKKHSFKTYLEQHNQEFDPIKEYREENPPEFALENVDAAIEELKEEQKQYVRVVKGDWYIRIGPGKGYAHIAIAHGQDEYEYLGKTLAGYYKILYKDKEMYIARECGEIVEK